MNCTKLMTIDSCTPDSGPPCPSGATPFDISAEVDGEIVTVNNSSELTPLPGYYPDMALGYLAYKSVSSDVPPGEYNVKYLSGLFQEFNSGTACSVPNPTWFTTTAMLPAVIDDEHPFVDPLPSGIIQGVHTVLPLGPDEGWGSFCCGANLPIGQACQNDYFLTGIGAPRRWMNIAPHSNTGGELKFVFLLGACPIGGCALQYYEIPPAYPLNLQLVQVTGQKDMVRSLYIVDWPNITMDPGINANWNGIFPTRTTYNSTTCLFSVPAVFPFGGSSIAYSQTVLTSPNGCGWVLTIKLGLLDYWVGYKVVGESPIGTYMRDASFTDGPGCFSVLESP